MIAQRETKIFLAKCLWAENGERFLGKFLEQKKQFNQKIFPARELSVAFFGKMGYHVRWKYSESMCLTSYGSF